MIRRFIFSIFCILISWTTLGQTHGQIYLNIEKDPCLPSQAYYTRIILKDTELTNHYLIQDYFLDGSIHSAFQVSSDNMVINWNQYKQLAFRKEIKRNGFYRLWYHNGQLKFEAHYQNNKAITAPKYWLASGETAYAPMYFKLDQPARFPGGEDKINEYLEGKIKLMADNNNEISQKLFVDIAITKNGKVCSAEAQNSVNPELDAQILKALMKMPNWEPAEMDGKKINTICTLPICF
ncbi:MAG: energy transducer TonB [Marinifilaceae bacterium]